ncbi:MAG TPA: TonB-dependent siderophore receptor [Opitutaceae bacterium]
MPKPTPLWFLASLTRLGLVAVAPFASAQSDAGERSDAVALDAFTVSSERAYSQNFSSIGSKDNTNLRQIPQSLTVITQARIQDQNLVVLEDAMRKTTGMLVLTNDPGRSSIFARGFEIDNYLVDGLPAPVSSRYGSQPELVMFENVEVLRGPAGLYGGAGEPGGTVNLTRKRAGRAFGGYATASIGSWENYRGEVDLTAPLLASGRARTRLVGSWQDADGFQDLNHRTVSALYANVEFDLGSATNLSLSTSWLDRDIVPTMGLPAYTDGRLLDVDRSTYIGTEWSRFSATAYDHFAEVAHRLANGGHIKVGLRATDRYTDYAYAFSRVGVNPTTNLVGLQASALKYWEETLALDAHASLPFELFFRSHNVVIGIDHRSYEQTNHTTPTHTPAAAIDVYAPTYNAAEPAWNYSSRTRTEPVQTGVYGQLRLALLPRLTAVGGARVSWYDSDVTNLVNGAVTSTMIGHELTPYGGLVYELSRQVSAYASVTEIFQPQTFFMANGGLIDPRVGRQLEAGLKGEFFKGRLNTHFAAFNLRDRNRALVDASDTSYYLPSGEVEVRGFEAELSGQLLPGWEVMTGYAYTETEYLAGTPSQVGAVFNTWTPKHHYTLWTRYDFQGSALRGWSVGGGVKVISRFYGQSGAIRVVENGYAVVDLLAAYRFNDRLELKLTVNNALDEVYYTRLASPVTFNYYGEPRSALAKVTYKF